VLCLGLSGCNRNITKYYNGYYGVEIRVNNEWFVSAQEGNATLSKADSRDPIGFHYHTSDDGYSYVELVTALSSDDIEDVNVAMVKTWLNVLAEGVTLESFAKTLLGDSKGVWEDGTIYEYKNIGYEKVNGRQYYKVKYTNHDDLGAYCEDYYYTIVGDALLSIYVYYSMDSSQSVASGETMRNAVYVR